MNVTQLKTALDEGLEKHFLTGEEKILITVSEPSVASRAGVEVKNCAAGFDWEKGQFRIEPEEELTRKSRDRDTPMETWNVRYINDKGKRVVHHCRACEEEIEAGDKYCSRCGQAVKVTSEISREVDCRTKGFHI